MEAGKLPVGWVSTSVGEVCSNLQYGYTASSSSEPNGPRFLRITDIQDGLVAWPSVPFCQIDSQQLDKYLLRSGDLVFARTGGTVGKSFLIGHLPEPAVFASYLIRLSPSKEVDPKYLYYFFQSTEYWEQIGLKKGGLQGNVNAKTLSSVEFCLSPLAEQHRIVAKIEELFSELDQGVASLKTAREQLKVYRQSLLKNAFEGKLTAATGWREKPLGQLLGFLTSGSRGWAAYYSTSGDLFVRAQNIKHDRLELDDVAFVALPSKAEGLRTRIQQGDLLITITGANVTKSALVKHDLGVAYVSQHVALCRPTTEILPEYLYWFIVAEAAGRKQLTDMAYGAGKPGLNLENIRSVNIPFPSLHEQQEIVEQIESKLSEADQLDQTLATALQQADALRQSILKKAFHGQLVKQAKNEEPATALLERIRAGKLNGMSTPRNRRKSG